MFVSSESNEGKKGRNVLPLVSYLLPFTLCRVTTAEQVRMKNSDLETGASTFFCCVARLHFFAVYLFFGVFRVKRTVL